MNNRLGASGAVIALIVVILIIIVIFVFVGHNGLSSIIPKSSNSTVPVNSFSVSSSIQQPSLYSGQSTNVLFEYFNGFSSPVNAQVSFTVGAPAYISISNSTRSLVIPSNMISESSIQFPIKCVNAPATSTSTFTVLVSNFWQNITTSLITYPYYEKAADIPSKIYFNNGEGFMSILASPISIQTLIPGSSDQAEMELNLSSNLYGGQPLTNIGTPANPNDEISTIMIDVENNSGVRNVSVYFNGRMIPYTVKGKFINFTLNDVSLFQLAHGGIPITFTATNSSYTSQNIIYIKSNYNYVFTINGPSISCQS